MSIFNVLYEMLNNDWHIIAHTTYDIFMYMTYLQYTPIVGIFDAVRY